MSSNSCSRLRLSVMVCAGLSTALFAPPSVAQDETGAQLVGINLGSIHTLTFSLATAMAAMAGAALLFMFQAYPTVGLKPLYLAWYVVMLVGLGNVYGAIVGGFIVALLQTGTQQFAGIEVKRVLLVARRMVGRRVQRVKAMELVLDLGSVGQGKAHPA